MSRTRKALELLRQNPKMTQAEAARLVGVSDSVVCVAVRERKRTRKYRCGHCGQIIPYLKDVIVKD